MAPGKKAKVAFQKPGPKGVPTRRGQTQKGVAQLRQAEDGYKQPYYPPGWTNAEVQLGEQHDVASWPSPCAKLVSDIMRDIPDGSGPVVLCLDAQYTRQLPLNKEPGVLSSLALALKAQVPALLGGTFKLCVGDDTAVNNLLGDPTPGAPRAGITTSYRTTNGETGDDKGPNGDWCYTSEDGTHRWGMQDATERHPLDTCCTWHPVHAAKWASSGPWGCGGLFAWVKPIVDITVPSVFHTGEKWYAKPMGCPAAAILDEGADREDLPESTASLGGPPCLTGEDFDASGYVQVLDALPWGFVARCRDAHTAARNLGPSHHGEILLQAGGAGGRTQTQRTSYTSAKWCYPALRDELEVYARHHLRALTSPVENLELLPPQAVRRAHCRPGQGHQVAHRDFHPNSPHAADARVVFVPLDDVDPGGSLLVHVGSQTGFHAEKTWHAVTQPPRSLTIMAGSLLHCGGGGGGRFLYLAFVPKGHGLNVAGVHIASAVRRPVIPDEGPTQKCGGKCGGQDALPLGRKCRCGVPMHAICGHPPEGMDEGDKEVPILCLKCADPYDKRGDNCAGLCGRIVRGDEARCPTCQKVVHLTCGETPLPNALPDAASAGDSGDSTQWNGPWRLCVAHWADPSAVPQPGPEASPVQDDPESVPQTVDPSPQVVPAPQPEPPTYVMQSAQTPPTHILEWAGSEAINTDNTPTQAVPYMGDVLYVGEGVEEARVYLGKTDAVEPFWAPGAPGGPPTCSLNLSHRNYLPAPHGSTAPAATASGVFAQFTLGQGAVLVSFGQASWSLTKWEGVETMTWCTSAIVHTAPMCLVPFPSVHIPPFSTLPYQCP